MILSLRRVRMYAAFYPKCCYIGRMLTGRAYIARQKSKQVKSAKNLSDDRNGFTESRFSEQKSKCAEMWGITRFETKLRGIEKMVGATCGQDITPVILNGFYRSRVFYQTAKRMRWKAHLLRCFMI